MLVQAASGLSVELDHRLRLPGRRQDRFDLYLPEPAPGLLIDLDPEWTHGRPGSLERDTAKTKAALAAGLDMERIRCRGLPPVPVHGLAHYEAEPGVNPEDWAEVVGVVLRRRGLSWKQLTPAEVTAALTRGRSCGSGLWPDPMCQRWTWRPTLRRSSSRTSPIPARTLIGCRPAATTCVCGGAGSRPAASNGRPY